MSNSIVALFKVDQPRQVWVLFWGWIASAFSFSMVIPFISIYFISELGRSPFDVGMFFFIATIVRSASQLIAGEWSDKIGRKALLAWGPVLRGLSFIACLPFVYYRLDFWIISIPLYLTFLFGGVYNTVANAAVADYSAEDKRTEAYALTRIGMNIGWAGGPVLGGFLTHVGYEWMMVAGGFLSLIGGIIVFRFIAPDKPDSETDAHLPVTPIATILKEKTFMVYCFFSFILFLVIGQLISTFSMYGSQTLGFSNADLGLIYSVNGGLIVLLQVLVTKLLNRWSPRDTMMIGSLVYGFSYMLVGLADPLWYLLLVMALITVGEMITIPAGVSLTASFSTPKTRGRYMGVYTFFTTAAWSLAPLIGGLLLNTSLSGFWIWMILGLFGWVAGIGFYFTRPKPVAQSS